ncbi:MAG: twin-arginine translocation signal domain-containing protein, partial [Deltaproteobacteria bacterium]
MSEKKKDAGNKGSILNPSMNRRTFMKATSAMAAAAGAAGALFRSGKGRTDVPRDGVPDKLETSSDVEIKYSVCLQCHGACGIKARVDKNTGILLKLDGNPFHPNCLEDADRIEQSQTDPASSEAEGVSKAGRLCPKGNAGIETLYNPYRILAPLKRVGARGSGKWQMIPWSQAIDEIADALLPYWTQGPDPDYTGDKTQFLIDPSIPELGYRNNQVMFLVGRLEHGQKEFTDRWFKYGFGTVNARLDHTSICETSHHVGWQLAT